MTLNWFPWQPPTTDSLREFSLKSLLLFSNLPTIVHMEMKLCAHEPLCFAAAVLDRSINQSINARTQWVWHVHTYNVLHTKRKYVETESELSSAGSQYIVSSRNRYSSIGQTVGERSMTGQYLPP